MIELIELGVPCLLHTELRVGEKMITMLLRELCPSKMVGGDVGGGDGGGTNSRGAGGGGGGGGGAGGRGGRGVGGDVVVGGGVDVVAPEVTLTDDEDEDLVRVFESRVVTVSHDMPMEEKRGRNKLTR